MSIKYYKYSEVLKDIYLPTHILVANKREKILESYYYVVTHIQ